MFENYKILLVESEFRNKTVNFRFLRPPFHLDDSHGEFEYTIKHRDENVILDIDRNFYFKMTDIKEYFSNFPFDLTKFKVNNIIIPSYDFDLILDLSMEKYDTNFEHDFHLGGSIFNYITFSIVEFTLDDEDKSINHRTLHEFIIGKGNLKNNY